MNSRELHYMVVSAYTYMYIMQHVTYHVLEHAPKRIDPTERKHHRLEGIPQHHLLSRKPPNLHS